MVWVRRLLIGLFAIAVLAVVAIYVASEMKINRTYPAAESRKLMLSSRPDVIAEGERLARVYGCYGGCHGEDMEGRVFFEDWKLGRIIAPNLTTAMENYSVSELEAMIRQGLRPDGTSLIAMPSSSFSLITDNELAAILSFIQSHPRQDEEWDRSGYYLLARTMLALGQFKPEAANELEPPWNNSDFSDPLVRGEYLARVTCGECHGKNLDGGFAPDLVVAKGYDMEAFRTLISSGTGIGDRDLGLMTEVSKIRFSHMTEAEVSALHAFLHSR